MEHSTTTPRPPRPAWGGAQEGWLPADVLRVVAAASVLARWWYAGPASGAVMFPVTAVAAWLACG